MDLTLTQQLRRRVRLHRLRRAVQVLQDRGGLQVSSFQGVKAIAQVYPDIPTPFRYQWDRANSRCGGSCKCAETGGACKCASAEKKKSRNYCKGCTVM